MSGPACHFWNLRFRRLPIRVVFFLRRVENMEERERSSRPRGVPNAEKLKEAKAKYKTFEAAKEEYKRLKDINAKKTLTPESNAVEHARWVHSKRLLKVPVVFLILFHHPTPMIIVFLFSVFSYSNLILCLFLCRQIEKGFFGCASQSRCRRRCRR